ncbi:MAG TPA: 16S rRNA (cytosine(967)-C(5))-methyltransferase RsmB [Candidatus Dormibacteraeota bacterium]|nr:16S rRNA (cytosine(967)-C(5))-methyltransferase RsmB [Candidatus Dormibacteraeota bacterium]
MPVSPSRAIAYDVLSRVEAENAYAADALHALLGGDAARPPRPLAAPVEHLKRQDAALATELVFGVLRWQRLLDVLIERQAKRPAASLDMAVRLCLRLGAYQLLFLDRIPPSAAVNESVELVKRARKGSAASIVNAVLRHMPRGPLPPAEMARLLPIRMPEAERMGILHSHPTWMVARWLERLGEERTKSLLIANNRPPLVACTVLDPDQTEKVAASLREDGLSVEPGRLLGNSLVVRGGNPIETRAFREGRITIQDEASQVVALLAGVRKDQAVLDLCAAPGNKTLVLARAAGPQARIVAADLHGHRLRALGGQLRRTGTRGVKRVALDATFPLPFACRFDRVLVDAPCSGTGTLARNPEIRWRLRPEDIADLAGRQARILRNALSVLSPGGRLVYATCSVEPEENEGVVRTVIGETSGIRLAHSAGVLAPSLAQGVSAERLFDRNGFFRSSPDFATDGFFAAVFERD